MKFYYEGSLIRTSTRTYTHAVITPEGKAVACSSSREGAEKARQTEINSWTRYAENYRNALKAIEVGKEYYTYKEGNRTTKARVNGTREFYERRLHEAEKIVETCSSYKVVELEARP